MAIADLIEKLSGNEKNPNSDDEPLPEHFDVPDDLAGLDELPPDPRPVRNPRGKTPKAPVPKTTVATRKRVEESLYLMISLPAGVWELRDAQCGGALNAQARALAASLTPIVCRNPAVLAWLTGPDARFMDWLAVWIAAKPVASAVWSHHVLQGGRGEGVDDGAFDASQYPAPTF